MGRVQLPNYPVPGEALSVAQLQKKARAVHAAGLPHAPLGSRFAGGGARAPPASSGGGGWLAGGPAAAPARAAAPRRRRVGASAAPAAPSGAPAALLPCR